MSQINYKVQKIMLKKEKRKEIGKIICMCVYLSAGSSSVVPFPQLVARSHLRVITIIIIIITKLGTPSRPINLPRILSHL